MLNCMPHRPVRSQFCDILCIHSLPLYALWFRIFLFFLFLLFFLLFFVLFLFLFLLLLRFFFFPALFRLTCLFKPFDFTQCMLAHGEPYLAVPGLTLIRADRYYSRPDTISS